MFERYTSDARQAIFFARYEASLIGSPVLEVEHLWLGVLHQNKRLLKRLAPHITDEVLRDRMQQRGASLPRVSMTANMPLSDATKCVLSRVAGTDTSSQTPIKVEDLVLALLHAG